MQNFYEQAPFSSINSRTTDQATETTRILYFAPNECWPRNTGAKLRNYYLAREMARNARLSYLCFSEGYAAPVADPAAKSYTDEPADSLENVCEQVSIVLRERGYTLSKMIRGALGRTPLTVLNYTTNAMARELERLLYKQDFDIVQVEGHHLASYVPIIRSARSRPVMVCDWHNIDSEVMRRYSEHAPSALHRLYAKVTARSIAAMERRLLNEFDAHIVVSERDREHLRELAPDARVFVIDNGVDVNHHSEKNIEEAHRSWISSRHLSEEYAGKRNRIVFVGSMDYHANIDACAHFAREVWPEARRQNPDLVFTIVGRKPAESIRALAGLPGIEVTGTVEDVRPFYREALAAVVPLRVGGGSRLKILESMAAGVPVISTRLGAEGIRATDGEDILMAETPKEFCRAISAVSENDLLRQRLARAARSFVSARYDWSALGSSLLNLHARLLNQARHAQKAPFQRALSPVPERV